MENSNNITLYHATNFDYSRRIIKDGAIKGRLFYVKELQLNGHGSLDLAASLEGKFTLTRILCLADNPILASACSDHGSDVVFEVKIPYRLVKGHILGPGTYETINGVEQIPLEMVTKIMSNNPNETKKALTELGRLDIIVEECSLAYLANIFYR